MSKTQVIVAGVRTATVKQGPRMGTEFQVLDLEQPTPTVSKSTGEIYMKAIKCSLTTSLSKTTAEALLGSTLPGSIVSKKLEAADFREWKNPSTGELVTITTRNVYSPAGE